MFDILKFDLSTVTEDEAINIINQLVSRLKEASYARGYKDGFSDGRKVRETLEIMGVNDDNYKNN